jgi:putative flippase GtrA
VIDRVRRSFISRTFVQYSLIGVMGVLLDFISYVLLVRTGLHPIPASFISVSIAIANNFVWNALWNFKRKDHLLRRFLNFYAVGLIGIVLTSFILLFAHDIIGLNAVLSKIIAIPPVVALQFLLNKKLSFGKDVHIRKKILRLYSKIFSRT